MPADSSCWDLALPNAMIQPVARWFHSLALSLFALVIAKCYESVPKGWTLVVQRQARDGHAHLQWTLSLSFDDEDALDTSEELPNCKGFSAEMSPQIDWQKSLRPFFDEKTNWTESKWGQVVWTKQLDDDACRHGDRVLAFVAKKFNLI